VVDPLAGIELRESFLDFAMKVQLGHDISHGRVLRQCFDQINHSLLDVACHGISVFSLVESASERLRALLPSLGLEPMLFYQINENHQGQAGTWVLLPHIIFGPIRQVGDPPIPVPGNDLLEEPPGCLGAAAFPKQFRAVPKDLGVAGIGFQGRGVCAVGQIDMPLLAKHPRKVGPSSGFAFGQG
jgi:hypothetical protein